jgi:putative addiction module CopG family antidote
MTVKLDPQVEKFINEQVSTGRFASATEALEAGVARLMLDPEPDVLDKQDLKDIRKSLEELEQGDVVSSKELHQRIRERYLNK